MTLPELKLFMSQCQTFCSNVTRKHIYLTSFLQYDIVLCDSKPTMDQNSPSKHGYQSY